MDWKFGQSPKYDTGKDAKTLSELHGKSAAMD